MSSKQLKLGLLVFVSLWMMLMLLHQPSVSAVNGRITSFESFNYSGYYIRHFNFAGKLQSGVSPLEDAQFKVVTGLADSSCISLESVNFPGYYLRHKSFVIYLEKFTNTDLFKKDATFRIVDGLADSSCISFQSYNYPTRYLRHYNFTLQLDAITNETEKKDATFRDQAHEVIGRYESLSCRGSYIRYDNQFARVDAIAETVDHSRFKIVTGLADSTGISFEAVALPGFYLRHQGSMVYLNPNDGSDSFKQAATFKKVSGLADSSWVSFQAYDLTDCYLKNINQQLVVAPISNAADQKAATFLESLENAAATTASLTVNVGQPGFHVSPTLYGVFFEEINHAGDGGLYAELIRNRSFEDASATPEGWSLVSSDSTSGSIELDPSQPLNSAQTLSLKLTVNQVNANQRVGVANNGFWGINVIAGNNYKLAFYARASKSYMGHLTATLESKDGSVIYAKRQIYGCLSQQWHKYHLTLTAKASDPEARLVISSSASGTIWFDVVSLFPPTYKNRPNGLRIDLAHKIKKLKPRFIRFPGGCYVEGGKLLADRFQWKNTIGDIAKRPGHLNQTWGYRSSDGLGYHEYLQMCEDMRAEPLYVVNCGISHNETQPISTIDTYVQDVLDAIEYANGPVTSVYGGKRAANGHPAPFNLKYIEIGNENNFQNASYQERYPYFYNAIKKRYPEMHCIANTTMNSSTTECIDEHYYTNPQWFISNTKKYDSYNRSGPQIYVGEYACTSVCGKGNLIAAVGEAAFMVGMERNSDLVTMSSYAPLFVNANDRAWNPDLICFDSSKAYGTPSYYVQQLFAQNTGDTYLPTTATNSASLYVVSTLKTTEHEMIIKVVNASVFAKSATITVSGASLAPNGAAIVLTSGDPSDENSFTNPTRVAPVTQHLCLTSNNSLSYLFPGYSVTILRLKTR